MTVDRRAEIVEAMARVRARTLELVAPLSAEDYASLHSPFAGPVAWDVPHIANFEELWLVKRLGPDRERYAALGEGLDEVYNAILHPKPERAALALPTLDEAVRYAEDVRGRALEILDRLDLDAEDPLTRDGFVHEMVLAHEGQHQETMLITLSLAPQGAYVPKRRVAKARRVVDAEGFVHVPAGTFRMGSDRATGTYDCEWPARDVHVEGFWMQRAPVRNREFLEFIEAGGYEREDLWSEDGWMMKLVRGFERPLHWLRDAEGRWWRREFDRTVPLDPDEPVVHVSWHEAEAYANFRGMRLPTEAEWEKAARFDPETGTTRTQPWGDAPWTPERANLDQRTFGPDPVGSHPEGVSAVGCHQMVGDVWEWTATEFDAYPGFDAFPYDQYSKEFMARGFYVLRGGSWATTPRVGRAAFRNWHQQDHQQEFAGFRLASDRAPEASS